MKKAIFYMTVSLLAVLITTACQNDNGPRTTGPPSTPGSFDAPQPAATGAVNASVEHYICPSGHVGFGSDSQGTCSQCGIALVHNQAYHNNTAAAPTGNPMIQSPGASTPQVAPPAATEPAQNAAGVWHYTCNAGCAGGAGSAGICSNCGGQLAHNQAYHN